MKDHECCICLLELKTNPVAQSEELNDFMKTPCGHKFHKLCITDWMDQKQQCPICRGVLPVYFDLTDDQVQTVIASVKKAVKTILGQIN